MLIPILLIQLLTFNLIHCVSQHPVLIVVSYDAFRFNYFDKNVTPHMEYLKKRGTYADYMINVFPTKTFPNHQSIATGLYSESHGVIGNSFYDPQLKQVLKIDDRNSKMFVFNDIITPIWTLNQKAGKDRFSGSMMWPGANFDYQNVKITYSEKWDTNYDWYKKIDTVISWIKNPIKPANLVMLYFEEPDLHGHIYGPESETVINLLRRLDNITKYLDDQIKSNGLVEKVNVIHLSDHGFVGVSTDNIIDITKYLKPNTYEIADTTPCLHVIPDSDYMDETYNKLKAASKENNFTVYKKQELPNRWHFKNNRRTPPIFVLADKGYGFQDLGLSIHEYAMMYHIPISPLTLYGVHGYDNDMEEMHPFFMARGPRIKKKHKVPPFHSVDLFNLFCDILNLKPVPNNGTYANIRDILVDVPTKTKFNTLGIAVGAVILAVFLVLLGAVITLIVIKKQQNITTTAALNKRFPQTFTNAGIEAQHLLDEDA